MITIYVGIGVIVAIAMTYSFILWLGKKLESSKNELKSLKEVNKINRDTYKHAKDNQDYVTNKRDSNRKWLFNYLSKYKNK